MPCLPRHLIFPFPHRTWPCRTSIFTSLAEAGDATLLVHRKHAPLGPGSSSSEDEEPASPAAAPPARATRRVMDMKTEPLAAEGAAPVKHTRRLRVGTVQVWGAGKPEWVAGCAKVTSLVLKWRLCVCIKIRRKRS